MAYETATRNKVRAKYVQGLPLTSAAAAAEVPYNTARTWKRQAAEGGDDWDIARNARKLTKSGFEEFANQVLHDLAEQFLAMLTEVKTNKDLKTADRHQMLITLMDGYSKVSAASVRGMPHTNRLAVVMEVIRYLGEKFKAKSPKLHAAYLGLVQEMGPDLQRDFGVGAGK